MQMDYQIIVISEVKCIMMLVELQWKKIIFVVAKTFNMSSRGHSTTKVENRWLMAFLFTGTSTDAIWECCCMLTWV